METSLERVLKRTAAANAIAVFRKNSNPTRERGTASTRVNPSLTRRVTIMTPESKHALELQPDGTAQKLHHWHAFLKSCGNVLHDRGVE